MTQLGTFSQYVVASERSLIRIGGSIPFHAAALVLCGATHTSPSADEALELVHILADAAGANRPLVYVLGTCGLRFGEVAELRWRDLDLKGFESGLRGRLRLLAGCSRSGLRRTARAAGSACRRSSPSC